MSSQVPAALGMKKAILRGAPPTLKLPNMQTVAEARMAEDTLNIFKLSLELND